MHPDAVVEGTLQLYKDDVNNSLTSLCHFLHLIHTLISNDNTDDLQESKGKLNRERRETLIVTS